VVDPKPGRVTIFYRPVDRFSLRFEGDKDVVAVIFDYIIFDGRILRPTLGPSLNVDVCQVLLTGAGVSSGSFQPVTSLVSCQPP